MEQNVEGTAPSQQSQDVSGSVAPSKESTNLALLCHLLGLLTSFIGPLILWLVKKDEDPFIEHHGREALNFQITLLIASIVGGILTMICIGFILLFAVWAVDIIFSIIACVAASKGQMYKYPVTLRLIK
jgi:uncharacterized Tic20 family protein